ncbi:MAG: hypothetical protein ACLTNY_05150 [Blautia massiliensis (ex Durand et al. 2017)]
MAKILKSNDEARKALKPALTSWPILSRSPRPQGPQCGARAQIRFPLITNDGVIIAKEIELEDPFENMGAALVREVTFDQRCGRRRHHHRHLLAQAMIHEGQRICAGANPIVMRKAWPRPLTLRWRL